MATQYFLPDVLVTWPWKRMVNPLLAEVSDEADAWVKSLELLEPTQLRKFYSYKFSMYIQLDVHFFGHERLIDTSLRSSCRALRAIT